MKHILSVLSFLLFSFHLYSQSVKGNWEGTLHVNGIKIPLIYRITTEKEMYRVTLESPTQNAKDIPAVLEMKGDSVQINMPLMFATYRGKLIQDSIKGTFEQNGAKFPLVLSQMKQEKYEQPQRPQTPKPPFSYSSKDYTFVNQKDHVTLAGTLTLPKGKGPFPAVVLISGSGPQNRNEEIMGHQPFWVIADYLSSNGIAVLRYDDRGVAQSTGNFASATSFDFAEDALAAITFLKQQKKINTSKIGVIGHSEGGMIAEIISGKNTSLNFAVLLAAPGKDIRELMIDQTTAILRANGSNENEIRKMTAVNSKCYDILTSGKDNSTLRKELKTTLKEGLGDSLYSESQAEMQIKQMLTPWYKAFISFRPADYLKEISVPVLAINGDKDLQVDVENLDAIEKILKNNGNQQIEVHRMNNMNHLFQSTETGYISEYYELEESFSPKVLEIMKNWILLR